MLNILIASLPAIIFIILFYFLDKDFVKKSWFKLLIVLIVGAVGSYICYRFEMHFGSYFKKVKDSTYLEVLFYAIFGVAIFEEGYKWLISFCTTSVDKDKKPKHILIYCVMASIGFAWFENIVYFAIPYGLDVTFQRMFTAFPSHICNAIWMSYLMILCFKSNKFKRIIFGFLSLVIPVVVHALYNSFLYGSRSELLKYNRIYLIFLCLSSIYLVFKEKKKSDC
ncbi:MAG: PrsW family intramembrane metalloprotease [Bacilli bacterium]|nr:PrsW family intramembrane metalloprotease [Bacilli bacterium]